MGLCESFLLFCFSWSFLLLGTHQLQSSQTQVLLQLRKHLEYPKQLEIWNSHNTDFCSISSLGQVNITCLDNLLIVLRIKGDKIKQSKKSHYFNGFSIQSQTLSDSFSLDSFVTTLSRLNSLRVLSLVSLGIWGQLPDKVHRLSSLEYLDLSSNFLFGSIPPRISAMAMLQTLKIDGNFLNDTIPDWFNSLSNLTTLSLRNNKLEGALQDFSRLSSLQVLDLSGNRLSAMLPPMPKGLVMLFVSENSFSGKIPVKYGKLSGLQHIDMSHNALIGTPPAALFSLPNISYFRKRSTEPGISSGSLPGNLICGSKLDFIDISNNSLTGDLPSCLRNESKERVVKFGGNCLSIGVQRQQHEQSHCKEVITLKKKEFRGNNVGILVGVILGLIVLTVLLVLGFIIFCRRYCPQGISKRHLLQKSVQENSAVGFSTKLLTSARFISQAGKVGTQGLPACRIFSMEELMEATKNFDSSALLGEGSYGRLYKGRLYNGTEVAIRCLPLLKKYTIRNVKLRLELLSKLRHQHLVCLLGHCLDGGGQDDYSPNKVYFVSEYVPSGTFRDHLSANCPGKVLNWSERLAVLVSVAKAVRFLHTGIIPGFFCNRLKTNNILLNEHGMAKLSDYGLSILTEETDKSTAKDSLTSWQMTSLDDDAYSFGYILLEALVGSSISSTREAILQNNMASLSSEDGRKQIVEPAILASCSQESLSIVLSVMYKCICPESSRPSFEDILWNLQYAVQVQEETADGDQKI
ncbi:probable inactive leucine-rich repeat receptor-like protein kinase At3g03770 [Malus domestica]|uniref:probable inactive leucine-rich repeat receptor-like protein kinase At3g03770 n=1 Tax=Malus domestica TaxID=3750 RepID=UPI0007EC579A